MSKQYLYNILSSTLFSLCLFNMMNAQDINSISGVVTDTNNETIPGATIRIKHMDKGTFTNTNGLFAIDISSSQDTIIVSSIGYKTIEIPINGKKKFEIKLEFDMQMITETEIVAYGYGDIRRRDLTGSINSANMEDLAKVPTNNIANILGGRIAGVQVTSPDGGLNENFNIVIRGAGSLTQSTEPLYVIDGFPTDAAAMNTINVNDIKAIDVLKDASATAIYGSRGANGVVIVTTKSNNYSKRTNISYSGSMTISTIANPIELMDGYDFVCLQKEIFGDDTKNVNGVKVNAFEYYYLQNNISIDDYKHLPQYNWQNELFRTAISHNHHVSMTGGHKDLTYSASLSYCDKQGIIINSALSKYQGRFNLSQNFKKVTITANASYSKSIQNGGNPSTDSGSISSMSILYSTWAYRPVSPSGNDLLQTLYDKDVDMTNDYRFNPILSAKNEYRKNTTTQFNANININWTIVDNLNFKITGGYLDRFKKSEAFNGSQTQTGNSNPNNTRSKGINASLSEASSKNLFNEYTLGYILNKGEHRFNILAGFSMEFNRIDNHSIRTEYITNESFGMSGIDKGNSPVVNVSIGENKLMSGLGRINYNYASKYYLTASFRADGSSKFAPRHRWGYFPSASAAWTFSRENFIKRSMPWLSHGKIRFSWGLTGNNRVGNYDYLAQLVSDTNKYRYPWESSQYPGYVLGNVGNAKLKWETTQQYNVGLDLGFFKGRLNLNIDYYIKMTQDLLLNSDVPLSSGFGKAMLNIGELKNNGIELTISVQNIRKKDFYWNSNLNIAYNKNVITALNDGQTEMKSFVNWNTAYNDSPAYISIINQSAGQMYGFKYLGTYKYDDFDIILEGDKNVYVLKQSVPSYLANTQPGDPKYEDINHDGKITDADKTVIGNGQPLFIGGLSNDFKYRNWELNIFFQWNYGNNILNANRMIFENPRSKKNTNMFKSYIDRWTPANSDSNIVKATAKGSEVYSSLYIEDGSYLKLKAINIGYTFKSKKNPFKAKLYLAAENIFTLTSYSGGDPEVSTRHSILTPGFDWSAYPRPFNISLGLNLNF